MNHNDHVDLIRNGIAEPGGMWADFGSGWGAFTLALRDVAGDEVEIWSVDRDAGSLRTQRAAFEQQFPGTRLHMLQTDFTAALDLPPLDGIVAANSIHFVRDRVALLRRWRGYLKPTGRLILVEYDTDSGNQWVPFPVSFASLPALTRQSGFAAPSGLHRRPSRFSGAMYSALLLPLSLDIT